MPAHRVFFKLNRDLANPDRGFRVTSHVSYCITTQHDFSFIDHDFNKGFNILSILERLFKRAILQNQCPLIFL